MEKISEFVVGDLQCPSCVCKIQWTLENDLGISPANVSVSLISQTVQARHSDSIPSEAIRHSLRRAGYKLEEDLRQGFSAYKFAKHLSETIHWRRNVCKPCQAKRRKDRGVEEEVSVLPGTCVSKAVPKKPEMVVEKPAFEPQQPFYTVTQLSLSGLSCSACVSTIRDAFQTHHEEGVFSSDVNLLDNSAKVVHNASRFTPEDVVKTIEDLGYHAEIIKSTSIKRESPSEPFPNYRVSFHITGMTCASCASSIRQALENDPQILKATVDLMSNSGTAIIAQQEDAERVKYVVESTGYGFILGEIVPINPIKTPSATNIRTINVRLDGLFCSECPEKVVEVLQSIFGVIDFTPTTLNNPVIVIRYRPSPPEVSIRSIFTALESSGFKPSLEKSTSIEERSRLLQAHEQRHLLWRIIAAVVIAIPTLLIGVIFMALVGKNSSIRRYWEQPIWGNTSRSVVALFFLATPVQFFIADYFHRRAFHGIVSLWRRGSHVPIWKRLVKFGSMDLLISLGASVAYLASLVLLIMASTKSAQTTPYSTTFFDTTVFLTMFILLGRYLESYTKHKAADAVGMLLKLRPTEAILQAPDGEERVSTDLLEVGDIVKVPKGSTPPGDGTVLSESSVFDESSLTGESRPVTKNIGDPVFVGSINIGSVITIKLEATGGSSMLDKIVEIVRQGQLHRAPIERFADNVTGYFVPAIVFLAILTWIIWMSLGFGNSLPEHYLDVDEGGWTIWSLQFAITVFVIACPCGIGLAAPTACYVGAGLAAKHGILVQGGGEAFQEASLIDCVAFDKTGTLTQGGEPKVTDVEIYSDSKQRILSIAKELENVSTHTLALAIRSYCQEVASDTDMVVGKVEETPGKGIQGRLTFNSDSIEGVIGNEVWMKEHNAVYPRDSMNRLEIWKSQGKSVVIMATTDLSPDRRDEPVFHVVAMFAISDPIRAEAPLVVKQLQAQGITTWMISGDNAMTAVAVANMVGIDGKHVIAGVLPDQKAEKIRWLQSTGRKRTKQRLWRRRNQNFGDLEIQEQTQKRAIVAMVGDGINDAPALAVSDLGIAIGSGSDIAIGSAKFILLSSNLITILTLFDLSKVVYRRVKFNFFWAMCYNILALPIAAGVVYPAGFRLDASWAALLMALSSVSVVLSSLHLKLYKPPKEQRILKLGKA